MLMQEFFQQLLPSGTVASITKRSKRVDQIYKYYVVLTLNDGSTLKFPIASQAEFSQRMDEYQKEHPENKTQVVSTSLQADQLRKISDITRILGLALLVMVIWFYFISSRASTTSQGGVGRGMGGMIDSITKTKTKMYSGENIKITFKDVAGHDQAKVELREFVEFLQNPEKYKKLGARIPRGAIMSGPPGTGKTLMAKAVAGESGVPFFAASGSEFVEIFVGVGAARVRDLFATARSEKKAIIFIDEIDAVGQKRDSRDGGEEREQTLNQLLVEMDGFGTSDGIIVFAATNRFDMLDSALVRPGRFDRNVELNLPDLDARRDIYKVHLKKLKINPLIGEDEYARRLATLSPGFSGSDIATICNEAAIQAVRGNKDSVDSSHFEEAVERLIGGVRVTKSISPEEEKTIAYHEAGHGVVSWFLKGARPLLKVEKWLN